MLRALVGRGFGPESFALRAPAELLPCGHIMAAIGRFQKGAEIFHARVVEGQLFRLRGDVFASPTFDKKPTPFKGVKTLTPVAPSKIFAIGLNYADHAREQNKALPKEPLFWFKAPTSLIPDGGKIEIPYPEHRTDYEAELAIVIGRRARNVTPASASRYILATRRRWTSATGTSRIRRANGRGPNHLTLLRRWGLTSKPNWTRRI